MTTILRLTHPLHLLFAALAYLLGVSLADYLAIPFHAAAFWLGLAAALFAQGTMSLLAEAFRPVGDPLVPEETLAQRKSMRDSLLYTSYGALAVLAVIAVLLFSMGRLALQPLMFIVLSLLLVLLYGVPPMRLVGRGFGEALLAIQLGYVIAGAITAEIVFNWPGLGTLTVDALSARDYPVLQGVFLLLAISVVLANLVADLVYGLLDPRVRA